MVNEIKSGIPTNARLNQQQYEEIMACTESINLIKQQTMDARVQSLKEKRVVGTTCAATGFEIMKNMTFKVVILDECSQMLEP